jgi:deoxycytidine triphosphate deaminase
MRIITDRDFKEGPDSIRGVIEPFDERHLTPAGIDLTIGGQCYNVTDGRRVDLSKGGTLTLQHGDFARVLTRETIRMPSRWFAMIYAKTSLAGKGLTHLGTKIDPGFEGQLLLTFQYLGNEKLGFREGDRICNVTFIDMEETPLTNYKPQAMKIIEVPLRPAIVGLSIGAKGGNVAELRQFYSKEMVEFYVSFAQWLQAQEERIDKAMRRIDAFNRDLLVGVLIAAIGGIVVVCGTVFVGLVQLVLRP